ncbi:MAG: hypothetical protein HFE34_01805 [Clostridia bacterium]|nr:hypothetical protein [Clostridia bacterium]
MDKNMERYTPQAMMFALLAFQSQAQIEYDDNICGTQKKVLEKRKKLMLDTIGKNKPLNNLMEGIDLAYKDFHTATVAHYYKEGFMYGAQLMLEICGYEKTGKKNEKLNKLLNLLDNFNLDKDN